MKMIALIAVAAASILTLQAEDKPSYKANEISIDAFGGVRSPDLDSSRGNYGLGVQYYLTESLGAGVYTSLEDIGGQFIDNISFRGLWRIPVAKHAFYFFGGATRQFRGEDEWSLQLGPGYEYRPINHVGLFGEIGMDKELTGQPRDLSATARAGLRLTW